MSEGEKQTPPEYLRGLAQGRADCAGEIAMLRGVGLEQDVRIAALEAEVARLRKQVEQAKAEAFAAAREAAAAEADAEPELPGEITAEAKHLLERDPVWFARLTVVATKRVISKRIRALRPEVQP